uniref:Ribosome-inactivating protein bryodin II n=1 Tax=Bryonia dioica TaxID=3652 RepID=RIP2_BRYDI|nr:RecName: Full=Ribosome-inactivating protein bryodin II; AltName: Full=BD2; AltName: Full=rRNA N-glycosidase; Flags: Precursor [Bryonia dioica]
MRSIGFYSVLALYVGAHVTEDVDINFSLIGATGATYKTFIRNLRTKLTVGTPRVYDIPVLRNAAAGLARFQLVTLTNYNGESVTVALDVVNVYVVAYRAGNTAYFLADASTEANNVLFAGINHVRLPYGGNYDGLETAAGRISRENIELGFSEISSAIGNMFRHNPGTSVPRAFIVIIQTVSEAARFKYIEQRVSENVGTKFKPDPAFLSLQNAWGSLSEQIQIAQTRGGEFARPVELRTVSNTPTFVTNVNSPVVKGIALLLYFRVNVGTDNVFAMSLSTY